jgi:arginase
LADYSSREEFQTMPVLTQGDEPMPQPARPIIDLYGVATDAGASARGTGMGPEALRIAGLVETLGELGHAVDDRGDLRHSGSAGKRQAEVLALAAETSVRAKATLDAGRMPLFLGGDHSVAMGTVSGAARHCAAAGKDLHVL